MDIKPSQTYLKQNIRVAIFLCLMISACEPHPMKRTYEEITIAPQQRAVDLSRGQMGRLSNMPDDEIHSGLKSSGGMIAPETETNIQWKTPKGWIETKGSGLRLASFTSREKQSNIDCSIVVLGGKAGDIKPNLIRWLGQINVPVPPTDQFDQYIAQQDRFTTEGKNDAILFDFTQLQKSVPTSTSSMMATIIATADRTIFIKMTGSIEDLQQNKGQFRELSQSIK